MQKIMQKIIFSFLCCYASMAYAHAAELKIGFLNPQMAITVSGLYTQDIARVQNLEKRFSTQLSKLEQKRLQAQKEFRDKNSHWDAETIMVKQKNLTDLEIRINRNRSDAQDLLRRENKRLDARITQHMQKAVQAYGKSHHYTIILQKGQGIFYTDESIDISADIGHDMRNMK